MDQEKQAGGRVLRGLRQIAAYLGVCPATVRTWCEQDRDLARACGRGTKAKAARRSWIAHSTALDEYLAR